METLLLVISMELLVLGSYYIVKAITYIPKEEKIKVDFKKQYDRKIKNSITS